jgi:putative phosphoesterase
VRIAIVSDIHGNRTAFEAVLADLGQTSPDLILHGGDLADAGSGPTEIVDQIRSLGWQGVAGNTDLMLASPATFEDFASRPPGLEPMWTVLREMAAATRESMGEERLAWLRDLPLTCIHDTVAVVHASPENPWLAPSPEARDEELLSVFAQLGRPLVVYGHIHRPYIRNVPGMTVANSGSVGLPYEGDRRASYVLIDGGSPAIRRVKYDIEQEIKALRDRGQPHADWVARILESGAPQMP